MENIFNDTDYHLIVHRINSLTVDNNRRWGKMNVNQVLEHCSIQLKLALNLLPSKRREGSFIFRTQLGRWLTLYVFPWPHGSETPSQMNMQKNDVAVQDFFMGKKQLLFLLGEIKQKQMLAPHPFYDELSQKDWGRLIWKHINHHLKQFSQ
ncbi:MAG: DUF1569 domain-containing protein [Chitinophagaceae bacterium]